MERKQQKKYMMDEAEAQRYKGRKDNMQLIQRLQTDSERGNDPNARSIHTCYVQLVGIIPDYHIRSHARDIESESTELQLKDIQLYQDMEQLEESRAKYALFEDNMAPKLIADIHKAEKPSYRRLVRACSKYEKENWVLQHEATSNRSYTTLRRKGLDEDEAKACAFAIAFYTGSYCETLNRNSAIYARNENRNASTNAEMAEVDPEARIILYYLVKGLSLINFHWGIVTRSVQLTNEELQDYKPGVVVTWLQFSSSNRGETIPDWFKSRNTYFIIHSLTGRSIKAFSNCAEDEDEILFLPYSSFLVCHVEVKNSKHHIYMRQIELGISKHVVLWVDDHIFEEQWENKEHMERAATLGLDLNVHFIPKSNTKSALAYLDSPLGKRLKKSSTFRIITDMNRDNESPSHNAGIRLIKEVRRRGFKQPCMIFTGDAYKAFTMLNEEILGWADDRISITESYEKVDNFVKFK